MSLAQASSLTRAASGQTDPSAGHYPSSPTSMHVVPGVAGHKRRSRLTQVSDSSPFPDDVPLADALEQQRPAAEAADLETVDPDERVPTENGDTPLESNAPDWQEQHQVVETHDEDEVREE